VTYILSIALRSHIRFFWILIDHSIHYRLATMKCSISSVATFTTFLSLLANTQAASNTTDGPSCGVAKTDDSYFSVVGVQGTGVHPRQELRELEKDTQTWNIFLQAFARFQAMDQGEKVSYYKVAGMTVVLQTGT
jgi:tyrosinase